MKYKYNDYTTIVKLEKSKYRVDFITCDEPKDSLLSFYSKQTIKPDYAFNGGFFNTKTGDPVFNFEDENEVKSTGIHKIGFGVTNSGEMKWGYPEDAEFKDFMSGYPYLVHNNVSLAPYYYADEISGKNPRTAYGYDKDYYYTVLVDGRTKTNLGMTFDELARVFTDISATFAMAADGGGSTIGLENGQIINQPTEMYRPLDNVVCFYRKYWRCQVGAYVIKQNAYNMELKLKLSGFDTYVRQGLDGFWRVQCGAYDNVIYCTALLAKLKLFGYKDAYMKFE